MSKHMSMQMSTHACRHTGFVCARAHAHVHAVTHARSNARSNARTHAPTHPPTHRASLHRTRAYPYIGRFTSLRTCQCHVYTLVYTHLRQCSCTCLYTAQGLERGLVERQSGQQYIQLEMFSRGYVLKHVPQHAATRINTILESLCSSTVPTAILGPPRLKYRHSCRLISSLPVETHL